MRLVRDLADLTSAANLARRLGTDPREIKRWKDGKAKPQGKYAQLLMEECQSRGINWRKYQRLTLVYDVRNTFEENTDEGPHTLSSTHAPYIPDVQRTFLGYTLNSPLGIPACVLTIDSRWIEPFSRYGFDVLTAKTVRTRRTEVHPFPNWSYLLGLTDSVRVGEFPELVRKVSHAPDPIVGRVSTANSFGMPSPDPEVWQPELVRSREA